MATIESISKRLDDLDKGRGYFKIEDYVLANPRPGESQFDAMVRENPRKTIHPDMMKDLGLED